MAVTRPSGLRPLAMIGLCAVASAAAPRIAEAQAVDALFDLLCGRTVHFYDESGNQIEYTSGDGTAYLWFHDEPQVIVGTWGVYSDAEIAGQTDGGRDGGLDGQDLLDAPGFGAQVCYRYDPGAFGPEYTGTLFCFSETELFETVVQGGVFNGDRYGLRDGTPPFVLPEHPFADLQGFDADFPLLPPEPACGVPLS